MRSYPFRWFAFCGLSDALQGGQKTPLTIDFHRSTIQVGRLKGGSASTHFLSGRELRALRELQRQSKSRYVFVGERGELSAAWFRKMFARIGERAKMPFPVNPHMLRHACGFKLANDGVDTRTIQACRKVRE